MPDRDEFVRFTPVDEVFVDVSVEVTVVAIAPSIVGRFDLLVRVRPGIGWFRCVGMTREQSRNRNGEEPIKEHTNL